MQTRPAAEKFIREALKLRSSEASDAEVKIAARVFYPTNGPMRSRFLRLCCASQFGFDAAIAEYKTRARLVVS